MSILAEYFKLILQHRLRSSWWLFLAVVFFALINLNSFYSSPLSMFLVIFGFAYPLASILFAYNWAYSIKNKFVLSRRHLIINSEKITAVFNSDSIFSTKTISEVPIDSLFKKVNLPNYWLLYIAKGQFVVVPKDSFKDQSDLLQFEKFIRNVS